MQSPLPDITDSTIHLIELAGMVGMSWLLLKVKDMLSGVRDEQTHVKEDLLSKQNSLQIDFDRKHAQNTQTIAVHEAEDKQKFDSLGSALVRIETKVDKIADDTRRRDA